MYSLEPIFAHYSLSCLSFPTNETVAMTRTWTHIWWKYSVHSGCHAGSVSMHCLLGMSSWAWGCAPFLVVVLAEGVHIEFQSSHTPGYGAAGKHLQHLESQQVCQHRIQAFSCRHFNSDAQLYPESTAYCSVTLTPPLFFPHLAHTQSSNYIFIDSTIKHL